LRASSTGVIIIAGSLDAVERSSPPDLSGLSLD